jgi:hypothetical protein
MANKKVSQLTSKPSVLTTDLFPIADPTTGQLFKTTISDLGTAIGSGVSSVNTLVGAVVLDTDDIQELVSPTNKWFTDTRARAALSAGTGISYNSGTGVITNTITQYTDALARAAVSLTTTGSNGSATYNSTTGVLNVPAYTLSGLGGQPLAGNLTALAGLSYSSLGFIKMTGVGTLALDTNTYLTTSDAASTYVPYTGATGNVNIGSNLLITAQVKANGSGGLSLNSNNGTQVANLGAGGGANITFYGGLTGTTATFTNSGSGIGLGVTNSGSGGDGIKITHTAGRAFNILSSANGYGIIINNETIATSIPFTIQKQGAAVITMTDTGGFNGATIDLSNSTASNALRISHTNTSYHAVSITATGGSALYATGTVTVIGTGTYTGVLTAQAGLANGTGQGFTFGTTSGVLAITSQLSAYLPLSGGTLTGALSGTSATFSAGTISSFGFSVTQNSTFPFGSTNGNRIAAFVQNTLDGNGIQIGYDSVAGTGIIAGATNVSGAGLDFYTYDGSSWANRFRITKSGAASFFSSLSAGTDIRTDGGSIQVGAGSSNYYTRLITAYNYPYVDSYLDSMAGTSYDGRITFRIQRNNGTVDPKMTILPTGNVLVNLTSTSAYLDGKLSVYGEGTVPAACFKNAGNGQFTASFWNAGATGGTQSLLQFVWGSSPSTVGSITSNGTIVSYNVTSDYRLKEDLKPIKGLEIVNKIKVYDYKWKSNDSRMDGVIAHELAEVLPYAVTGVKDGAEMQAVDYSKIVPVMVQAIKELKAELDTLKNK